MAYVIGFVAGVAACIVWPQFPTAVKAKVTDVYEKITGASTADDEKKS